MGASEAQDEDKLVRGGPGRVSPGLGYLTGL